MVQYLRQWTWHLHYLSLLFLPERLCSIKEKKLFLYRWCRRIPTLVYLWRLISSALLFYSLSKSWYSQAICSLENRFVSDRSNPSVRDFPMDWIRLRLCSHSYFCPDSRRCILVMITISVWCIFWTSLLTWVQWTSIRINLNTVEKIQFSKEKSLDFYENVTIRSSYLNIGIQVLRYFFEILIYTESFYFLVWIINCAWSCCQVQYVSIQYYNKCVTC